MPERRLFRDPRRESHHVRTVVAEADLDIMQAAASEVGLKFDVVARPGELWGGSRVDRTLGEGEAGVAYYGKDEKQLQDFEAARARIGSERARAQSTNSDTASS